jgi:hypothetical protein
MRMFRVLSSVFCGLILFCDVASAAVIQPTSGRVLINRGTGYEPVTQSLLVGAGDSVMVSVDGGAQLVYSDQCSISVKPGGVVTVAAEAPCKGASADFDGTRMGAGFCSLKDDPKSFCEPEPDHPWLPVAAFAGVLTVGIIEMNQPACP